jgi:hypothetical protein
MMQVFSVKGRLGLYTDPHLQIESALRRIAEGATVKGSGRV